MKLCVEKNRNRRIEDLFKFSDLLYKKYENF